MGRWLTRRLLITFVTFIGITMLVFTLMRLAPVSPVDILLFNMRNQGGLPPADIQALHDKLAAAARAGQADPRPVRRCGCENIVTQGSLGFSFVTGRPVARHGRRADPADAAAAGHRARSSSSYRRAARASSPRCARNRSTDYVVSALGLSVVAIPSFFLGLAAIYIFSVKLGWLPGGRHVHADGKTFNPVDWIRHLIMPAIVLGLAGVGPILRYVRTSILETLGQDYLVTARAKGLDRAASIVRHAFPNALLPLITLIGIQVGTLMAGAFITEQIFTWPGMGTLGLSAINSKDYPVLQAFAMVVGIMVLLGNLLADLAYGVRRPADPAGVRV